ncbi:MAG: hypothetical protein LM554_00640 [Desulfurococcaceae archaeon]|jgi:hypothetical protein|nr:hypothetical protein [Desulfurococcaceae archaeon]
MTAYKLGKDRKKLIEEALRDLDPATRELARRVLENMLLEEEFESQIEGLKRKFRGKP